jgi:hypothetical protein
MILEFMSSNPSEFKLVSNAKQPVVGIDCLFIPLEGITWLSVNLVRKGQFILHFYNSLQFHLIGCIELVWSPLYNTFHFKSHFI